MIDWPEIDQDVSPIYRSARGEKAWPPLAMLKALLLSVWYDLSDVKLAEALDDRASFRRFCGFAAGEPTPERRAFVRFRKELVRHGLDMVLFEAVTRQLDEKNVIVKTGTLVDATIIAFASIMKDEEARWVGHRRKAAVHGYKAHVATDAHGGIVRRIEMTPANVNDGRMLGAVLPSDPGNVHADLAYASSRNKMLIRDAGGSSRLPGEHYVAVPKRLRGWKPGTARSAMSVAGSRRSSVHGSAATVCGACGGSDLRKLDFRCG